MPDDTEDKGPSKARTPKDEKRRQQIMVGAGVAGVLLTVVLIRKSGKSQAQQAFPVSGVDPNSPPPPSAGSYASGVSPVDFYGLQAQVQGLSAQLSQMSAAPGPIGGPSAPISSSPTPMSVPLAAPIQSSYPSPAPGQPTQYVNPGLIQLQAGNALPKATGQANWYSVDGAAPFQYG